MSNDPQPPQGNPTPPDPSSAPVTQQVQYSHISARLPDKVSRGTFATNVLVLTGSQEFACDFLLRMVPPPQLAARVILPYSALGPVVVAVQENLDNYKGRFGAPITLPPPPPNTPPPNIAELYEQMKISDDVAVGAYANTLMITHTAAEFCLDFILDLFPRPVVTSRIYLSAAHVPPWLETLKRTLAQVQARTTPPPPFGSPPSSGPGT